MFDRLAELILLASETPADGKLWQTKVACDNPEVLEEAFLAGFYDGISKEASDTEVYMLASELGTELGINLLYNMNAALKAS